MAHLALARHYYESARPDEAEPQFRAAVERAGRRRCEALVEFTEFLMSEGRDVEAEELAREAVEENRTHVTAHYLLSRLLARRDAGEEAERFARIHEVLRQLSDHASTLYLEDEERNLALRRELVELYPEYRRARLDLVRELLRFERYEEALPVLQEYSGGRFDPEILFLLARLQAGHGSLELARNTTVALYQMNPALPEAVLAEILGEWKKSWPVSDAAYRTRLAEWAQAIREAQGDKSRGSGQ
jgi:hypothetical protein